MNNPILIYHNQLLPISEVFIYNQSVNLKRYTSYFLGAKLSQRNGIPLPLDRVRVINSAGLTGKTREALFKLASIIPPDIKAWIKETKPQLIHAHFGFDGAMALPLAKYSQIPLIVSFLGTDATMKDDFAKHGYIIQRLYLRRRDELIKQTTLAIVPSEFLKQKVIEQGFSEEKIRLIHHGVDLNKFNIADAKPRWGNILYVGRLIRRKGLQFLLEALSRVKNQFPEITLTIIGDGRERTKFEEQAENLLGNRFTFLGAQPHAVVREYMARAYVFCMPSITEPTGEVETFGLVFAEAHAYGVPVVSFDSGAISEVVLNNKTGFLAEESNTDELARYLTNLLENLELRKKMGVAARERVERMFDLEKQNEELEAVYDEILRR